MSGQLRPRRDFRDYLFAAGARTHAAHHTRPTRGVRNPTGKASNRPRSPADDARTDNLCGEFRPRTAAQRCPTLADVYPDSSRRKYERCLATVSSGSTRVVPARNPRIRTTVFAIYPSITKERKIRSENIFISSDRKYFNLFPFLCNNNPTN